MSEAAERAAIYARISEDPRHLEKGVARQVEDCRELARVRGWQIVGEPYVDNDISALKGKTRPAYADLLALIEAGGVDRVVTYMTSRLWRNRSERAEGIERLRDARVSVSAVKGPDLDLTTAAGRMLAGLLGEFDTHESEVKGERVARAAQQRAEEGRPNGAIPYGWDRLYERADDGRVLTSGDVVNKAQADVVREIVDRLLSGDSLRAIAADLNERGVASPQGKTWIPSSVRKLALREANVARRVYRGEVIGRATWPALVEEDKHDRVRALLNDPARNHVRDGQRRHLLSFGIGRCGVCGGLLRAATAKRRRRVTRAITEANPEGIVTEIHQLYLCLGKGCVGRNRAHVDELVAGVVTARLASLDVAQLMPQDGGALAAAQREIETVQARLNSAADDYAEGSITSDQLRRITARLRPELDRLEDAARRAAGPAKEALNGLGEAADVAGVWSELPVTRQRAVLNALGLTITILPTRKGAGFDPTSVRFDWADPADRHPFHGDAMPPSVPTLSS